MLFITMHIYTLCPAQNPRAKSPMYTLAEPSNLLVPSTNKANELSGNCYKFVHSVYHSQSEDRDRNIQTKPTGIQGN
jgi:hypothetical protein